MNKKAGKIYFFCIFCSILLLCTIQNSFGFAKNLITKNTRKEVEMENMELKELLTRQDIVKHFDISEPTLLNWFKSMKSEDDLEQFERRQLVGRRTFYYYRKEILAYLQKNYYKPTKSVRKVEYIDKELLEEKYEFELVTRQDISKHFRIKYKTLINWINDDSYASKIFEDNEIDVKIGNMYLYNKKIISELEEYMVNRQKE